MKYPKVTAGQTEACINRMGGWDNFLRYIGGQGQIVFEENIKPVVGFLLELVHTIILSATTDKFFAREKFVVDTVRKAKVKINYLSDNFRDWFLDKVEDPMLETTLQGYKLNHNSLDESIIKEQGGEAKAETTLTEIYSLMEKQPNGEDGVLLINSQSNIFYVLDTNAVLRTVFVSWRGIGWCVRAKKVSIASESWYAGSQVFSHMFVCNVSAT